MCFRKAGLRFWLLLGLSRAFPGTLPGALAVHHVATRCGGARIAFLASTVVPRRKSHRSQNVVVFQDLLEDSADPAIRVEYTSPKYPPYPYYDAPRNLFFDASSLKEPGAAEDDDSAVAASEEQRVYMKNSALHRFGEPVDSWDTSPIAEFDRAVGKDHRDYVYVEGEPHPRDEMRTDVAEYDAVRPGIAPWPSSEELQRDGLAVQTSLFIDLDPNHILERHLIGKPMRRNDIKTLGEARTEQRRWLQRSYHKEWPLSYEEFAVLPIDMREAYYANRYDVCDEDERFLMVLNYRRALGQAGDRLHPLEFRYMEDSYTYTPRDSPVLGDLKNWDDPLDAPWRLRVEECIRDCVTFGWPVERVRFHTCFEVYDVTWLAGAVKIVIEQGRDEGGPMTARELKLMMLKLEKRLQELDEVEHTESISNHHLMLLARPNVRRMDAELRRKLVCRRDWNANAGQEVTVTFTDSYATTVTGVLLGSHSTLGLDLDVGGERRTLPLNFVKEVKLAG